MAFIKLLVIRKEMAGGAGDLGEAVRQALCTTGLAIAFTATTLVCGVAAWVFGSTLRFQADAAQLLIAMMIFNMLAALLFVPAWVVFARPRFLAEPTGDPVRKPGAAPDGKESES